MPKTIHNCSIYCSDCGKIVIEGVSATLKVEIGVDLPILDGESVTESGNHHAKFRRVTEDETTTKRHSNMVLYEGGQKIGEFITTSMGSQAGITLSDEELAAELDAELRNLKLEDRLRRRGGGQENLE